MTPRIVITSGEPAGIGIDLCLQAFQENYPAQLFILGDPSAFEQRAKLLGFDSNIPEYNPEEAKTGKPGSWLCPLDAHVTVEPGQLNSKNSEYVLRMLDRAINGCMSGDYDAMVTAPIQKSIIADTGMRFTGHTEYLAEKTGTPEVVMMLACPGMKVALVTTHIPLSEVPAAITGDLLETTLRILNQDLKQKFKLEYPSILVCGLNPHAGEDGHIGREEIDTIIPVLNKLQDEGFNLRGPLPADTVFTEKYLTSCDAVLAMYHDQGLPALKQAGFGKAVNITLGLPISRTSVDHGTALDLAGSGKADFGSMNEAILAAIDMATGS